MPMNIRELTYFRISLEVQEHRPFTTSYIHSRVVTVHPQVTIQEVHDEIALAIQQGILWGYKPGIWMDESVEVMDKNNDRYEIWMNRWEAGPSRLVCYADDAVTAFRLVNGYREMEQSFVDRGWLHHVNKYWIVDTQDVGGETHEG